MAKRKYYILTHEKRMSMIQELDMPKKDKDNLLFLMNCSEDQMIDFLQKASQDDIDYAEELFKSANKMIVKKLQQMDLEQNMLNDDVKDFSQAKVYLKKFTLKGDYNGNTGKKQS
jgi:hypothetical protein